MMNQNPFLNFNFADKNGYINPLTFSNPSKVVIARTIDEILPCLEVIEQAINEGNYAAGYISYEAAPAFDPDLHVNTGNQMPLLWFGIFQESAENSIEEKWHFNTGQWTPTVSIDDYDEAIDKIQQSIRQGQTEQVNYTIHMESTFSGDTFAFYNQLQQAQDAKYTAYIATGDFTVLSASPELFFHVDDNKITTRPMKGTVSRGKTYQEDQENAAWLHRSKKNRAENKLIVDLMRNDLAKIAVPGSIAVPKSYEIEQYPTVYQMTSTLTADLQPKTSMTNIFKALFPCGSITGLPKEKTMQIIADLESAPREVYCGAIGFITPEKEAAFNVPIRTVTIDNRNGAAKYGVGGGITLGSTKEGEYEEVLAKANLLHTKRPVFNLLETLGLFEGKFLLLESHLKRLSQSAAYFNFDINVDLIRNNLHQIAESHPINDYKVRLLVGKNGVFNSEINPINHLPLDMVTASLADSPIDKADIFLYHKTTHRSVYDIHRQQHPDVFDVLLWNNHNEITEFTTGNIIVERGGELLTPPISCGLLAGTFRNELLNGGIVKERKLKTDELKDCIKIWYVNSVRKWVSVHLNK